jgi:Holliday junction resolvase RusA-like endonuclease
MATALDLHATPAGGVREGLPGKAGGKVMLTVFVPGEAAPQGSKSFKGTFQGKDGRRHAKLVEDSKALPPWRNSVRAMVEEAIRREGFRVERGGVKVTLEFVMQRPKKMPKGRIFPETPPDICKLHRAINDALHDSRKTRRQPTVRRGALRDDSQICGAIQIKRYARDGEQIGCFIRIEQLRDEQELLALVSTADQASAAR